MRAFDGTARRVLSSLRAAGSFPLTIEVVRVADFHFELPPEQIAQYPLEDRAASRMLVLDRSTGQWDDRLFRDLGSYLSRGDALILNNTRVLPARLFGRRAGVHVTKSKDQIRGPVEILLLRQIRRNPIQWQALVHPGRRIRVGEVISFAGGVEARIVDRGEFGSRVVEFPNQQGFVDKLEEIGHTPLPPYIRRSDEVADRERYQTVYATRRGAVAAPTAGLHFTPEILEHLGAWGVKKIEVTLHVGLSTFQPVRVEKVEDHPMHAEHYEIPALAARGLNAAKRRIAVGTTSVRTLEDGIREGAGSFQASSGDTDLFIYPGFEFKAVDALLTNFHLPSSTLLMLVCAFAGRELVLDAYAHAVREKYRFYSYGDCMLIL